MQDLNASLVQCQLAWENPEDNRKQFEEIISALPQPTDLVVLPEMFTTGFSMNALANAEEPGGATEQWLCEVARRQNCAVTGSIAVSVDDQVFNRIRMRRFHLCGPTGKRLRIFRITNRIHESAHSDHV